MNIFYKSLVLIMGITISFASIFAQEISKPALKHNIIGKVIDASTNEELQYVNIVLLKPKDSTLINGVITDKNGKFVLSSSKGRFILKLSFIGYEDIYKPIEIINENLSLGLIKLNTSLSTLEGVEITAEISMMEYQLDKRVINVDKNLVTAGGTASDVLENVPSVSVDDNGGVTLRGNSNVKILIDGKPSELYGNDLASILAQIPASKIENIEVITNPSAKYNPEGMSGIINIKLKEKGNKGLNGNISLSAGSSLQKLMPSTSLSAGINYSTKKFGLSASIDGRYSEWIRRNNTIRTLFGNSTNLINSFVYSKSENPYNNLGGGLRLGGDWYINEKNILTLSYSLRIHSSPLTKSEITNKDLWKPKSRRSVTQIDKSDMEGYFNTFGLNYQKKFNKADQELSIDFNWNKGDIDRDNNLELIYASDSIPNFYKEDDGESKFDRLIGSINYSHPFTEELKVEIGYNINYTSSNSDFFYFINKSITKDSSSYNYQNKEQIHAIFTTIGYNFNTKFSLLAGLRAEIVKSKGTKIMTNNAEDSFTKDYNSYFPSIHFSYAFSSMQSAQLSYSKRIQRPNGHNLLPTVDFSNPDQIRFGNPNLDPEYTDAIELGYTISFPKITLFSSLYYRQTNKEITRFSFLLNQSNLKDYGFDWVLNLVQDELNTGKLAQTFLNIAESKNYGLELIMDYQIAKWWKLNISSNIYGYYADGSKIGGYKVNTLNWDMKTNSNFTLPAAWTIQLSGQYYAPQNTIQGDMQSRYFIDIAAKKTILNKKGTLSISFRDVFGTRKRVFRNFTQDYFIYSYNRPYSQSLTVSFSYIFGENNKPKKRPKKDNDNAGSMIPISDED